MIGRKQRNEALEEKKKLPNMSNIHIVKENQQLLYDFIMNVPRSWKADMETMI